MMDTVMTDRLKNSIISPQATIAEAIAVLDKAGTGALMLSEQGGILCGLLTDGDIRRAVLRSQALDLACSTIANRTPVVVPPTATKTEMLHIMNTRDINHLPVVDADGRIVNFVLRKDLVTEEQLELSAVIMAGGFGKRLLPLTEQTPKPMLPVGDRPLLEFSIEQLRKAGIRRVNVTTHYLPDKIIDHFGDGSGFGVDLNYTTEDHPLGTAGGLKLMPALDGTMLVINGDILTGVSFQKILAYHREHKADITVGVRRYEVQVPYGVIECVGERVVRLTEKPQLNFLINAGLYLLEPSVYRYIPDGRRFDMTDLIERLIQEGRPVVSFPIVEYWLDVGRHADYEKAQEDVKSGKL